MHVYSIVGAVILRHILGVLAPYLLWALLSLQVGGACKSPTRGCCRIYQLEGYLPSLRPVRDCNPPSEGRRRTMSGRKHGSSVGKPEEEEETNAERRGNSMGLSRVR
jgi:hypothetical protein